MKNNEKKTTFRIGELSRLYDIGVDSIRYYEKMGLLSPIRNVENNYRLFTISDVRKLITIRELLNIGFSTEQIRAFEDNRNIDNTREMLQKERLLVDQKIADLQKKRDSIDARLQSIKNALEENDFETIHLLHLKKRGVLMLSDTNLPDQYVNYWLAKYMHSSQEKIDTIGISDCYTLDIEGSDPTHDYYRTENVFFYSDSLSYQPNHFLPEGDYLSLLYRGSDIQTKQFMPLLFSYAQKHQLTVTGMPMEFCRIDDYETAVTEEYLTELQLPVSR